MSREGKIALLRLPHADRTPAKLRPVLVLRKLPGQYDDWLVCMISTNLSQGVSGFDEVILDSDEEFSQTGLKRSSVLRISRLAVADSQLFLGLIGEVGRQRLNRIGMTLSQWLAPELTAEGGSK